MSFDQFQRYKTVQIIVEHIKEQTGNEQVSILEIGGNGQCNLEEMLPRDQIQYSSLVIPEERKGDSRFIALDGTAMPEIETNAYDIVIALDVFEHVPSEKRDKFLKETYRAAAYMTILCFPFSNGYNESAEKRANNYYKAIYGKNHIWLEEHIENGLPDKNKVLKILQENRIDYSLFEHGDIYVWEEWMKALFGSYDIPGVSYYLHSMEEYYEQNIYSHDVGTNNYRIFLLLDKNKKMAEAVMEDISKTFKEKEDFSAKEFLFRGLNDLKALCGRRACEKVVSTLYMDMGMGYKEEEKQVREIMVGSNYEASISYEFEIPDGVKELRFDPVEGGGCLLSDMQVECEEGKLSFAPINGWNRNGTVVFLGNDPQLLIDINEKKIRSVKITAEIVFYPKFREGLLLENISRIISDNEKKTAEAYKEKEAAEAEAKKELREKDNIQKECEHIRLESQENSAERDRVVKEKEELYESFIKQRDAAELYENAYNGVIESKAWKLTAPLRKILGKKECNR